MRMKVKQHDQRHKLANRTSNVGAVNVATAVTNTHVNTVSRLAEEVLDLFSSAETTAMESPVKRPLKNG